MNPIKIIYHDQVRRLAVDSVSEGLITFASFIESIKTVITELKEKSFSVCYKDEEDDVVTISSDIEIREALRVMNALSVPPKAPRFIITDVLPGHPNAILPKAVHENVACDNCGKCPIVGFRFKCAVRKDFDLCSGCEAAGPQPHAMLKIADPTQVPKVLVVGFDEVSDATDATPVAEAVPAIHRGVRCDGCGARPIIGVRYKCSVRPNYDLCGGCRDKDKSGYPLIAICVPVDRHRFGGGRGGRGGGGGIHGGGFCGRGGGRGVRSPPGAVPTADGAVPAIHRGITCDGCGARPVVGTRYKCTQRADYDLCETCKAKDTTNIPMIAILEPRRFWERWADSQATQNDNMQPAVHVGVTCDGCGVSPISGPRFNCTVRANYDLCDKCQPLDSTKFPMVRIERPSMASGCPFFAHHPGRGRGGGCFGRRSTGGCDSTGLGWRASQAAAAAAATPATTGVCFTVAEPAVATPSTGVGSFCSAMDASVAAASEEDILLQQAIMLSSLADRRWEPKASTATTPREDEAVKAASVAASAAVPAVNSRARKPSLRFVRDVTFPDGSHVAPGTEFIKSWTVRNEGPGSWPEGASLNTAGGDMMSAAPIKELLPVVGEGNLINLSVPLHAPEAPGRFVSYFRAQTADGQPFGQRLWADIVVDEPRDSVHENDWQFVADALNAALNIDGLQPGVLSRATSDGDASASACVQQDGRVSPVADIATAKADAAHVDVADAAVVIAPASAVDNMPSAAPTAPSAAVVVGVIVPAPATSAAAAGEGNDVPLQVPIIVPVTAKWERELRVLAEMGFTDFNVTVPLLEEHCGLAHVAAAASGAPHTEGLQRVVAALLRL